MPSKLKRPKHDIRKIEAGVTFVDHTIPLHRREAIAGGEQALRGVKAGCYSKVRIRPRVVY